MSQGHKHIDHWVLGLQNRLDKLIDGLNTDTTPEHVRNEIRELYRLLRLIHSINRGKSYLVGIPKLRNTK